MTAGPAIPTSPARLFMRKQKRKKAKYEHLQWSAPDNPRDAYGHCVPDRLRKVFLTRSHLTFLISILQEWRAELIAILPESGCRDIDRAELVGLIEALRTRLYHSVPVSACDCDPILGDNCTRCRGEGWVSMKSLLGRRRSLKVEWSELQQQRGVTPSESTSSTSRSPEFPLPPKEPLPTA